MLCVGLWDIRARQLDSNLRPSVSWHVSTAPTARSPSPALYGRCGCYLSGCTHCEVTRYVPQHEHNAACFALVRRHEATANVRYRIIVKVRPDLAFIRPMPPLQHILQSLAAPPGAAICTIGRLFEPTMLRGGRPLDDKFAIMPRAVAEYYFNATAPFHSCAVESENSPWCLPMEKGGNGEQGGKGERGGKGGKGGHSKGGHTGGRYTKGSYLKGSYLQGVHSKGRYSHGGYTNGDGRQLSIQSDKWRPPYTQPLSRPRLGQLTHSPYWATPQCVFTRHLLSRLPDLHLASGCLEGPEGASFPRLVRPA